MNLRSLNYFIAVAEELSFTRGAARVHIEQAPLSQSISRLEKEIGARLFIRNTRGVELTAEGVAFLETARAIVGTLTEGLRTARSVADGSKGHLAIGFVSLAAFDFVPMLVRNFKALYPQVELSLKQLGSEEQIELVDRRQLDGALIRPQRLPRSLSCLPVSRARFVCAVWSTHHLARRRQLKITELKDEPFLALTPDHNSHAPIKAQIASIFSTAGFAPRTVMQTNYFQPMIELVGAGLGIAIVPTTSGNTSNKNVRFIELVDVTAEVGLDFVWRNGSVSPSLLNFIGVVKRNANLKS